MELDSHHLDPAVVVNFIEVYKRFGAQTVCRGLSLSVKRGEVLSILGPSGAGKTVTIKMLIGLEYPDDGHIFFDAIDVAAMQSEDEFLPIRRRISMVFQGAALFDSLNVYENIAYPLRLLKVGETEIEERVEATLEMVGLPQATLKMPSELSGGMKKRIGLARAIITKPEIILYDEPTAGLDPINTRRIVDLILKLKERLQCTSIVIAHDMDVVRAISDKAAFMFDGVIRQKGSFSELEHSADDVVRGFVTGDPSLLRTAQGIL